MTHIQIFAIVWLVAIFALSIWRHLNLGLVALPGAFILAEIADIGAKKLVAGFPAHLVVLILGVTFLWNHLRNSGAADLLVQKTVDLTRHRLWLLPWAMCGLTALICAVGALPAAALVITLPAAIQIAQRENIRPALMGIVTIQGAGVGGFSPISPWGNLIATQVARGHMAFSPGHFFATQIVLNIAIALAAFLIFGGLELFRRKPAPEVEAGAPTADGNFKLSPYQLASLLAFCAFIVLALMRYDVGLTAFAMGTLLHIGFSATTTSRKEIAELPWNIVVMIAGLLMYVSILDQIGVLHAIGTLLEGVHQPSLVLMAVGYVGTIFANFESSSVAVLGLVMPLAIKSLIAGASVIHNSIVLALLAGSIAVIGASPFHLGGGLLLAEAGGDERTYKDLLAWAIGAAAILPPFVLLL